MFLYIGNKHTSINKYKKRFIDEFCKLSCTFIFFREFVTFYIFCSLVYQKLSDTDSKSMEYQSVWVVKGTVAVSAVLYPNNKQSLTICTKSTRISRKRSSIILLFIYRCWNELLFIPLQQYFTRSLGSPWKVAMNIANC